jgi:hypothetical protein
MGITLRIAKIVVLTLVAVGILYFALSLRNAPEEFTYGVSFSTPYAQELGLDPRTAYDAILSDLGAKHLRLAAHWTMIEPEHDQFDFSELDYQVSVAKRHNADIVLAVGRRLPRWPECHVPGWAKNLSWEEQKNEIREQVTAVVERYKDEEHIIYWQVENEPFLTVFAEEHCGDLDEAFLKEEIALVRSLDPGTPILVTDSGNLGTWSGAYQLGDAFGTSVYVYFWNPEVGPFRSVLPPSFYRVKQRLIQFIHGDKPVFLIELSAEPWLLQPVTNTPIEVQHSRMDIEKFEDIIAFAQDTRLERQYLWGAEWWYWLRTQGHDEFWERGKTLFD